MNSMSETEFEDLCCRLLQKMGFFFVKTSMSADGGTEFIATCDKPMFKGKYVFQCKDNKDMVRLAVVRELCSIVSDEKANKGVLITTGSFSYSAINFAGHNNIELIDGNAFHALLKENGLT